MIKKTEHVVNIRQIQVVLLIDPSNNYNLLSICYQVILKLKMKLFVVTLAIKQNKCH